MDEQVWKEPETGSLLEVTTAYDKALLKEYVLIWTKQHKKTKFIVSCAVAIVLCGILLWHGLVGRSIPYAYFGGLMTGILILVIGYIVLQPGQAVQTYTKKYSGEAIQIQIFSDFIVCQRESETYVGQNKWRYEAIEEVYEGPISFCLVHKEMCQIIDKRPLSPDQVDTLRTLFTQKFGEKFKDLQSVKA